MHDYGGGGGGGGVVVRSLLLKRTIGFIFWKKRNSCFFGRLRRGGGGGGVMMYWYLFFTLSSTAAAVAARLVWTHVLRSTMSEVLCEKPRSHFFTKFWTVNELARWGPLFCVIIARRASSFSLSRLFRTASTVLASSPGEACCFRFISKKTVVPIANIYSYT